MIKHLYYYISDTYVPYYNQAIEEYFLNKVNQDSLILYLWQNKNTVFIGKNQNPINELNYDLLIKNNGYLARRISGGGAVYHDLGNLNFTFISHKDNYDLNKQNDVILNALKLFDINAYKNGRNDLLIDERKFSGHAYYKRKDNCFHHGTIMIDVNGDNLQQYLKVSLLKLKDKGVNSVRSRVINLKEINNDINIDDLKKALIKTLEDVYSLKANEYLDFDLNEIKELENKYSNTNWQLGKQKEYAISKERKYNWGLVKIEYDLKDNYLDGISIYTDSLDTDIIEKLLDYLPNKSIDELRNKELNNDIEKDIIELILED